MEHSILAPSSAPVWGAINGCTGYVQMAIMYPETEQNAEAIVGNALHKISAESIRAITRRVSIDIQSLVDIPIDGYMIDAVTVCVENVADIMRTSGVFGGDYLAIEERIDISIINPINWGTPDVWLFDKNTMTLYVWDFKFGYGIIEAFENWQLLDYTAGILDKLGINGRTDQSIKVDMRIIQPRAWHRNGPVRKWVTKASDLRGYFNTLRANADEALSDKARLHAGPHCKNCSARHACEAAHRAALDACDLSFTVAPSEMPDDAVGSELRLITRAMEALEYRKTGLEIQAESLLRRNRIVSGYTLVPGRGSTIWTQPDNDIIAMGDLMGVNLRNLKAKTPTQAIQLGIDENVIKAYSEHKPGKLNLSRLDENLVKRTLSNE